MTVDSATMNRVHPEKDDPPHSAAYYTQIAAPPVHMLNGAHQASSLSKIEQARSCAVGGGREAFDPVTSQTQEDMEASKTPMRRTWQMLAQVAVLVGAFNPRDRNEIDIYHAPKVGTSRFMIHPNSKMRRAWDIVTAMLVLYVITMVLAPLSSRSRQVLQPYTVLTDLVSFGFLHLSSGTNVCRLRVRRLELLRHAERVHRLLLRLRCVSRVMFATTRLS